MRMSTIYNIYILLALIVVMLIRSNNNLHLYSALLSFSKLFHDVWTENTKLKNTL